jgi:hypothetical protein
MGSRLRFLSILVTLISFSLGWTAPALAQSSETAQTEQAARIDPQAMDLILPLASSPTKTRCHSTGSSAMTR